MQSLRPDLVRRVRTPGYCVMALLILSPLIEVCTAAWPFHPHEPAWRLSFAGTAGASLGWPVLGLFLTFLLAALAADASALLVVSGISILVGVLCVLQGALFALDAVQLKARVNPALAERYEVVSVWWLIKLCAAGALLFFLALNALRAARSLRRERKTATEKRTSLLVGPVTPSASVAVPTSTVGE